MNNTGYHEPSAEGAWLLPNRSFVAGDPDHPPTDDAHWRTYSDTAQRALELYVEIPNAGTDTVANQLLEEGRPFQDRNGNPRFINREDVRRIIANWPEYGGIVLDERAKDRNPQDYPPGSVTLNPERAVFPVELLYEVQRVWYERSLKRDTANKQVHPYPLYQLVTCHHCQKKG